MKTQPGASAFPAHMREAAIATLAAALLAGFTGCASPGPPLPPTLNLPDPPAANSLSAVRVGNTVHVGWTTPERTTDRLLIQGAVSAEICREVSGAAPQTGAGSRQTGAGSGQTAGETAAAASRPCAPVVAKVIAEPGMAGEAVDTLPAALVSGSPRLLLYRVQLKNASGRTAGPSAAVFAAAGDAPQPIEGFHARPAKTGVVLEWARQTAAGGDPVELERTEIRQGAETRPQERTGLAVSSRGSTQLKLIAGGEGTDGAGTPGNDAGGMIDRSAQIGHTYRYIAWRVRRVTVAGQQLEVRGAVSSAVTVPVEDIFPPNAPQSLVAVPGLAGGDAARPAIYLSWEPNGESRVAGYRVYRRMGGTGEWQRTSGADLVTTAAYRDTGVASRVRYAYRITAVGLNGLESQPSNEAEETAPGP